jgi:hypothetical protein
MGSIVEGIDQTTASYSLLFPFTERDLWRAVKNVEAEARELWGSTHGCEECGDEDPMTGYRAINPSCKNCHGDGTIF